MSFIEAIDKLSAAIERGEYDGYGPRPIPDPADAPVARVSEAFLAAAAGDRELLQPEGVVMARVLIAHAERSASRAVREQSPSILEESLRSLALSMLLAGDSRDSIVALPLPWRSSELLKLDPEEFFAGVAAAFPEPARTDLLSFSQRAPDYRTLACMGYKEAEDECGFRYERTW